MAWWDRLRQIWLYTTFTPSTRRGSVRTHTENASNLHAAFGPRRDTATLRAGMEMTSYPVLVEVQSEMARMKVIYDLYSAFEKFREDMSLTAWGELDVEVLKEGVDRAEREIKKLPKELKELSKYKAYELVVVNFKES